MHERWRKESEYQKSPQEGHRPILYDYLPGARRAMPSSAPFRHVARERRTSDRCPWRSWGRESRRGWRFRRPASSPAGRVRARCRRAAERRIPERPAGIRTWRASSSEKPSAENTLRLHVAAMNTNRARAELGAVQHQVVRLRAAMRRIGGELFEIFVMHRRERMMRGVPAVLFFVPLEHREIDHPQKRKSFGSSSLCRSLYFCAACKRKWPAGQLARCLRGAAPLASPPQPQSISKSSSVAPSALANFRHRAGKSRSRRLASS